MKRTILPLMASMLLLLAVSSASAQLKRFSIGPYVEGGFPVGDLSETHNTGIGAGLNADIKLLAGFTATGSVGYMHFPGKDITLDNGVEAEVKSFDAIPVRLGLKYKLFSVLYAKVEAGTAHLTKEDAGTAFIVSPGVGVRILMFDIQGKYEAWFRDGSAGFLGVKASINF
ncbi:hypothetical protein MKQ68_05830 [Chitinophaga horti]|uniref:Outer membrane protein beta-barrel domain-containing protein n=1 Tax=Chitinophaga horti TaxID=2920382 RepID=A0ABY6J4L2_9BACT|nr:hypothetical protein [Chitinophaga horti]UYQ94610.1 hypothetical protein MKQ68_05830 [Chitinophaga horti]